VISQKNTEVLSDYIISIKRNIKIIRFKKFLIYSIGKCFLKKKKKKKKKKDAQRGWSELKKKSLSLLSLLLNQL